MRLLGMRDYSKGTRQQEEKGRPCTSHRWDSVKPLPNSLTPRSSPFFANYAFRNPINSFAHIDLPFSWT